MRWTENEYLKQRVEVQRRWYSKRSRQNKRWFYCLRIMEIVLAALIPFLVASELPETWKIPVVGFMGICIAVITGIMSLCGFEKKWIAYRTTSETMKMLKYIYITHASPYDDQNRFKRFVNDIENLISKENKEWQTIIRDMLKNSDQNRNKIE